MGLSKKKAKEKLKVQDAHLLAEFTELSSWLRHIESSLWIVSVTLLSLIISGLLTMAEKNYLSQSPIITGISASGGLFLMIGFNFYIKRSILLIVNVELRLERIGKSLEISHAIPKDYPRRSKIAYKFFGKNVLGFIYEKLPQKRYLPFVSIINFGLIIVLICIIISVIFKSIYALESCLKIYL